MLGQIAPLQQTESVALTAAAGRITAAPVVSPLDVPPFANSAMDGYALPPRRSGGQCAAAGRR